MTAATVAPVRPVVTIGVDTHNDVHVAVALDQLGRRLGTISIDTTPNGYAYNQTRPHTALHGRPPISRLSTT